VQLDQIKGLPRADARHDSGSRNNATHCFQGTREKTLEEIYKWIEHQDPSHPPIFWLCGLAGIGKSTIAQTVAEHEDALHRLGASFFFSRDEADRRNSLLLFPTLAFQMALFNPEYRTHVVRALDRNPDVGRAIIRQQIEHLIIVPLQHCELNTQLIVIVIDALDECFPESGAEEILILWAAEIRKLSQQIRLLITSRPELHIRSKFQSPALRFISQSYILHDIEKSIVRADVELFLCHSLNNVAHEFGLATPWPTPYELGILVKRADVLFIYAATVIKFVADKHWADPHRQLRVLLREKYIDSILQGHASRYREVDTLYLQVLQHALSEDRDEELSLRFKNVVGTIVLLQDPLTSGSLELLLQLELGTVRRCLLRLHSVLLVPDAEDSPVRVFHPSFPDFLTSPQRCTSERFFISETQGHASLAAHCLQTMSKLLSYDVCNLLSGGKRDNKMVPDLAERLSVAVPPHLRYGCIYFAAHVSYASSSDTHLASLVEAFCKSKMLAWFEVLSLLERFDDAASYLRAVRQWYSVSTKTHFAATKNMATDSCSLIQQTPKPSPLVQQLLYDGVRFSVRFLDYVREGAYHIYSTALPFSPSCALKDQYRDVVDLSFVVQSTSSWDTCMSVIDPKSLEVGPVVFSPDGRFIVSGSFSGAVNVWNATSGGELHAIQTGHGSVQAIAVAPDGDRICSGSTDGAILIWDISTGVLLHQFEHSSAITSAVFCDDVHLICGDYFGKCCIWDSISGKLQRTYTTGQDGGLHEMHIAISSDDSTIALTSSKDGIHLWEWRPGHLKGCLTGHTDSVVGLAFLPVGQQLLSGSCNGEIILWDITDQTMLKMTCVKHFLRTFAVSPDGMNVAYASQSTITIQDVRDFHCIHQLRGHNLEIRTLAFSPDNATLVSTSNDRTLRLWDMLVPPTYHEQSSFTNKEEEEVDFEEFGWQLSLACNGHRIIQAYMGSTLILIRDWVDGTSPGSPIRIQEDSAIADFAVSQDGKIIATAVEVGSTPYLSMKKVRVWDAIQFQLLFEETTMALEDYGDKYESSGQVAVSADGSLMASDHVPGNAELCVWKTADMRRIFQFPGQVFSFAFSSDASKLVSLNFEMEICIWDVRDGTLIISASPQDLSQPRLVFSSDDHSIFCLETNFCVILDATTLEAAAKLNIGPTIACGESEDLTGLRLLQIRDQWLWEIDCAWRRKLCWLPPECRLPDLYPQMAWQGPYLALTIANGDIVILDIDLLRGGTPIPLVSHTTMSTLCRAKKLFYPL
jgi:WD40 repeat protein